MKNLSILAHFPAKGCMSTRRGISLSTETFLCCSRNAIFCACKISRSFADHPSKILISKVDKLYTGFTMIIQKKRRVRTSKQNSIHFAIRCHREKHLSRGESAALDHFSVFIFFGQVDIKESKTNIVASQYNSLARL